MLTTRLSRLETFALTLVAGEAKPLASFAATTGRLSGRKAVKLTNTSSNVVYIGGSDVTAENGEPIAADEKTEAIPTNRNSYEGIYVLSPTNGTVRVTEYYE